MLTEAMRKEAEMIQFYETNYDGMRLSGCEFLLYVKLLEEKSRIGAAH